MLIVLLRYSPSGEKMHIEASHQGLSVLSLGVDIGAYTTFWFGVLLSDLVIILLPVRALEVGRLSLIICSDFSGDLDYQFKFLGVGFLLPRFHDLSFSGKEPISAQVDCAASLCSRLKIQKCLHITCNSVSRTGLNSSWESWVASHIYILMLSSRHLLNTAHDFFPEFWKNSKQNFPVRNTCLNWLT